MTMKAGQWVHFWTKNGPPDSRVTRIEATDGRPGEPADVTGKGLYCGRGKIVRVEAGRVLICEERSNRLVELSPGERVEPIGVKYGELTLGDLRKFLEALEAAPDDVSIAVSLPVRFNCDETHLDFWPEGHPEAHDPNELAIIPVCGIHFTAIETNSSVILDEFVPEEKREAGEQWDFTIEIIPNGRKVHDALRGEDHD